MQENEKPDAKLVGLLRATRGAAIEDLTVDWGVKEDAPIEEEYEIVSSQEPAPPQLPPINLFDPATTEVPTSLGPEAQKVQLKPPPLVQQAPKSDQLPIPLYPGFRCSIFAIIKNSSNPGPVVDIVKIRGQVLGRPVTLDVPVVPVQLKGTPELLQESGIKLVHTLAAKALIQQFEDSGKSPEIKAEIERLGKRYSLASSVTSFVAIDESTTDVIPVEEVKQPEVEGMVGK